jgi:hypothetical protein
MMVILRFFGGDGDSDMYNRLMEITVYKWLSGGSMLA